jgi:hypothetical protein
MSDSDTKPVGHAVFFTLKDRSSEAIAHLVAECKMLEGHEGADYFQVGERGAGFDRPVNDQHFDVALYIVFKNRAAHDHYQVWDTHQAFIARNKDSWAKVRIFDAVLG